MLLKGPKKELKKVTKKKKEREKNNWKKNRGYPVFFTSLETV